MAHRVSRRQIVLAAIMLFAAGETLATGTASLASGTTTNSPQQIAVEGYRTRYEIGLEGCSRMATLVCTIAVRRVGDGRDNGVIVYAQSSGGTSTIVAGGKRYPATGARLANSQQRFAPDRYWKTYSSGEQTDIELEFAGAGEAIPTELAVSIMGAGSPTGTVVRFDSIKM